MPGQFVLWVQVCLFVLWGGWLWLVLVQPRLTAAMAPAGPPPRRNHSRSQFSTEGPGPQPALFLAFSPSAGGNLEIQAHGVQKRRRRFENRPLPISRHAAFCFIASLGEAAYRTRRHARREH